MKEYKVVLVRQEDRRLLIRIIARIARIGGTYNPEVHRIVARNAEEAIKKAKALVSWINKQEELGDHQRVELFAIYELRPDGSAHEIPIAARF